VELVVLAAWLALFREAGKKIKKVGQEDVGEGGRAGGYAREQVRHRFL
jgi:hypothetical protein